MKCSSNCNPASISQWCNNKSCSCPKILIPIKKFRLNLSCQNFNDVGKFHVRAKVITGVRPGQTIMYHSWENYQFAGEGDARSVSPSPINPVELAGDHAHLKIGMLEGQPGCFDRDTRIQIARMTEDEVAAMKDA